MIAFLFLLVCVHVVLIWCKAAPENTSPNATEGRRKKIKLRQRVSGEQYGVDLPAFAFDYSELLSSAVIERSDASRDLYLTIFLLGRQAAYSPGAVLALNTDQEPVLTWTTAMKRWNADRDLSSRSRLLCIIQNSELSKAAPYQAPAYWLTLQAPPAGSMAFNRLIEAVRCKIRAPSAIYTNRTYDSERRLLVDLVRRDKANSSATDKALVSSFNMRWSVRQGGYGSMSIASTSMSYWTMSSNRSDAEVLKRTRTPAPSAALQPRSTTSRARAIHACVPGVRPAKAGRAEVGMTMLLEFVEHLLLLGVQHVTLGVVLDVESLHMERQLLLLQKYLLSGQLTISPLSLPKTDDAPGIAGVLLSDALSETFFLNHCLQMSKGLADYVLVLRPYQFIIPTAGTSTLAGMARRARPTNSSLLMGKYSKYGAEKPSSEPSGEGDGLRRNTSIHSMFTRSRAKAKYQGSGRKDRETRRLAVVSSPTVTCSIVFQGYAAADPADAFFGPGDTAWTKGIPYPQPLCFEADRLCRFLLQIPFTSTTHQCAQCALAVHSGPGCGSRQ